MPELHSVETLFESIIRLAKARDVKTLTHMIHQGICLGSFQSFYNPIMLLARENDAESVEFLKKLFKVNTDCMTEAYAILGDVKQVDSLVKNASNRDRAALGYAMVGNDDEVNNQLANGAKLIYILLGYAIANNVEMVDSLIQQVADPLEQEQCRNWAAYGYAIIGNIKQVNIQIGQGASRNYAVLGYTLVNNVEQTNLQLGKGADRNCAIQNYALVDNDEQIKQLRMQDANLNFILRNYALAGNVKRVNEWIKGKENNNDNAYHHEVVWGYNQLDPEYLLLIMSLTDIKELRILIAENAKSKNDSLDIESLQNTAEKLNRIMNRYQLNFNQARALLNEVAWKWLFQGPALITDNLLINDIFWHAASLALNLSINESKIIFNKLYQVSESINSKWNFFVSNSSKDNGNKNETHTVPVFINHTRMQNG